MKKVFLAVLVVVFLLFAAGCDNSEAGLPNEDIDQEVVVIEIENDDVDTDNEQIEIEIDDENDLVEEEIIEIEEETIYVYVNIPGLNFRGGPSSNDDIIRVLEMDEQMLLIEDQIVISENQWIQVADKEGIEGWVYSKYVDGVDTSNIIKIYSDADYSAYLKPVEFESNPYVNVKGIYVTGYSAKTNIDYFINIIRNTEINTLIIDVKDDSGTILFPSETAKNALGDKYQYHIEDIDEFISKLKSEGIYLIARVVTFKSPKYASEYPDKAIVYKDGVIYKTNDGAQWGSPYDRELWEYVVGISREAIEIGFNEIQFDYVRFPTSGGKNLNLVLDYRNFENESKVKAIQSFIMYAQEELNDFEAYLSADVYGWTATATDDVGIGQHWEAMSNVIDIISPMFYPSHYGGGNFGFAVPDAHPYEVMLMATEDAVVRNSNIYTPAKIRPWIQAFTATWVKGYITYTINEVNDQIRALKEFGIDEYMIWNSSNTYNLNGIGVE